MRLFPVLLLIVLSIMPVPARASDAPAAQPPAEHPRALGQGEAVLLGLVEGVTEWLPVSSTGHLLITNRVMGLDDETPLKGADGALLLDRKGRPLTVKAAADTLTVVIQAGAIASVVALYWAPLMQMLAGLLGRNPAGLRLLRNLIVALLPAVVLGYAFDDWIEEKFFCVEAVTIALLGGAALMFWAEAWRKRRGPGAEGREPPEMGVRQSLLIGFMQCVAMWPGTSRSMMTIVGGYFAGLSPVRAAEFSFLLGLPTLAGAALLKGVKSGPEMLDVFGAAPVVTGCIVAAVSAALAMRFLVAWLTRHGLGVFAVYRIALAVVLCAWFLL